MDISLLFRTLVTLSLLMTPAAAAAQTDSAGSSESEQASSTDSDSEAESDDTESEESDAADSASDNPDGDEGEGAEKQEGDRPGEEASDAADEERDEPAESDSEGEEGREDDTERAGGSEQPEQKEGKSTGQTADDAEADRDSSGDEDPKETAPPPQPPKREKNTAGDDQMGAGEGAADAETGSDRDGAETKGEATADPPSEEDESEGDDSPISDLAESTNEEGFEPVEDIEESSLEEVTPAKVYPHVEWDGLFRVRSDADINFDLDTGGTSAIRPPIESNNPAGNPAKSGNELLWTANTGLRLDPTIHISETLRVHIEAGLLENVVFGSLSENRLTRPGGRALRPDPSRTVFQSDQLSPREREWYQNAVQINELWGEIETFLGDFRAGRMDNHWGLGMHANSGDCADCDFGDHVERIQFLTKPLGIAYASAAIDFPDQGVTSQAATRPQGQPYDLSHIDDARQFTFSIFRKPRSQKEKKLEQQKLKEDQVPVVHGGARFTYRNQKGLYTGQVDSGAGNSLDGQLVYRGLNMYAPDLWAQFLYNPDPETFVRIELEGVGVFGDIDNATRQPVRDQDRDGVNCFDEGDRDANPDVCSSTSEVDDTSQGISQIGAALESELYFGGPVRFGLNSGFASGGDAANWGYRASNGAQHEFYRFDSNYHVDLILFREVIGTVTNAYYANPYAQARFFESPDQRMEVQLDAIASRASNVDGTPAGEDGDGWLGLELDAAVRYLQIDRFQAGLEGGVLFPFGALDAKLGRERLTRPGGAEETFTDPSSATIPWTIQTNFIWKF